MKKILRILAKLGFGMIFIAVLALLSLQLFAPHSYQNFGAQFAGWFNAEDSMKTAIKKNSVAIVYPYEKPTSFEVTAFNPQSRAVLLNIYESVVEIDRNLEIKPGLAVSWGRVDEITWEFRLRPGVKFHDGKDLTVEDVVTSIKRAQNFSDSELRSMLANIRDVRKKDSARFLVRTKDPDPLLLNKLATVLVFPERFSEFKKRAMGTGPYELTSDSRGDRISLVMNPDYWGGLSNFSLASIYFIADHNERVEMMKAGTVDLVVNVPPGAIKVLEPDGVVIVDQPNLQVNFLLFNLKNSFFANNSVRQALRYVFDKQKFVQLTEGFAKPVDQFVSNGIFGFNPQITTNRFQPDIAKAVVKKESGFERPRIVFHMIDGLQKFGEYIVTQLELVGIGVEVKYLSQDKINESLQKGDADLYFLGWRSELGDAGDFLRSIAHSRNDDRSYGFYNGVGYLNKDLDKLIEHSDVNLSIEERKQQLQEAMNIVVEEDVIGIPLYESEVIYGYSPEILFRPRIDSYVLIRELGLANSK